MISKNPNVIDNFDKDNLSLRSFSERLERYLTVDHGFILGSLVVSLHGDFGRGKSTFLKMWENDLIKRRKSDTKVPFVINMNAWESDYQAEPFLAIISTLLEAIAPKEESSATARKFQKLTDAACDLAWFGAGLANSFVASATKFDPLKAGDVAENKKANRDKRREGSDLLYKYQQRRHALWKLKEALKEFFDGDRPKAFVFIDELDRCRPDYAVCYLETIKHVFDVHGIVFVLAIDYDHLANSAKALYGRDLNFPEYLRKFVVRSFKLPTPSREDYTQLSNRLTNKYIHQEEVRHSKIDLQDFDPQIEGIISGLQLSPRRCHEIFRTLGHISTDENDDNVFYTKGYCAGMVLMCVLKVYDLNLYNEIGRGKSPWKELQDLLRSTLNQADAEWWLLTFLAGSGLTNLVTNGTVEFFRPDVTDQYKVDTANERIAEWKNKAGVNKMTDIYNIIEHAELAIEL